MGRTSTWTLVGSSGGQTGAEWTRTLRPRTVASTVLAQAVRAWPILTPAGRQLLLAHPGLTEAQRGALIQQWLGDLPRGPAARQGGDPGLDGPEVSWGNRELATLFWGPEMAGGLAQVVGPVAAAWCRTVVAQVHPLWLGPVLRHAACPVDLLDQAVRFLAPALGAGAPAAADHEAGGVWHLLPPVRRLEVLRDVVRNPALQSRVLEQLSGGLHALTMVAGTISLEVWLHAGWDPATRAARLRAAPPTRVADTLSGRWYHHPLLSSPALRDRLATLPLRDQVRLIELDGLSEPDVRRLVGSLSQTPGGAPSPRSELLGGGRIATPVATVLLRRWFREALVDRIPLQVPAQPAPARARRTPERDRGGPEILALLATALQVPGVALGLRGVWTMAWARSSRDLLEPTLSRLVPTGLAQASTRVRQRWLRPLLQDPRPEVRELALRVVAAVSAAGPVSAVDPSAPGRAP